MSCQKMRERISTRLDGELNQSEAKELEEHLKRCPSCQEYERSLTELALKMKSWKDEKTPDNLQASLFRRILEKEKKRTRVLGLSFGYYRIPAPLAWAAVLLFAFLSFHLARNTFLEKEVTPLGREYEVATVQKEKAVPKKIFITSEDIVSVTTNYESLNP